LVRTLLDAGYGVSRLRDTSALASLVADDDGRPETSSILVVVGKFDGARPALVEAAGHDPRLRFCDLTGHDADRVRARLDEIRTAAGGRESGAWKPWFPVIDYERCENCKQCLSFCLFGVYGLDGEGRVEVQNPDHCKTDCPACARVCPHVAIIFPKYDRTPINGDTVDEEAAANQAVKVDLSALRGRGVRASLRARGANPRARFAVPPAGLQEHETPERLAEKIQRELDIPDQVMESLTGAGKHRENADPPDTEPSIPARPLAKDEGDRHAPPPEEEWNI
jgi:NAD-dependent dihydropyrimidine dehydrogenase PreA subunit